jgi:hypothetical protein
MPALRELIDATAAQHVPVTPAQPSAQPDSNRSKINASVPTDLVTSFEQAAKSAGVGVADALQDALNQWIDRQ